MTSTPPATAASDLVMQVLQEQFKSKDEQLRTLEKQLDRKDDQIASLNVRMRESNVLMRELQQRLAIAAPAASESFVDSAGPSNGARPSPVPKATKPSAAKTKAKPARPGL